MCIIAVAFRAAARYPLIVAANRDESHARPAAAAGWWPDAPGVLGGRDLTAGGSWLAMSRDGRFAAVTNVPGAAEAAVGRRSRGLLVSDYLREPSSAADFAASAAADAGRYAPFNMLVLDEAGLWQLAPGAGARELPPGVHVLTNAEPGTPWPKVERAHERLAALLDRDDPTDPLLALLAERHGAVQGFDDHQVSLFQLNPLWGTRCSSVVLLDDARRARFVERSFNAAGEAVGEVRFDFSVPSGS